MYVEHGASRRGGEEFAELRMDFVEEEPKAENSGGGIEVNPRGATKAEWTSAVHCTCMTSQ
jgi:hypothetical protein